MAEPGPFLIVDYNGTVLDYVRKIVFAFVKLVVHILNHYVVLPHVFWMFVLRPLMYLKPAWYWFLEGISFNWLLTLVSSWAYYHGYTVGETGCDVTEILNDEAVVISNHQSTADVPTLMYAFQAKKNLLKDIMWIQDFVIRYSDVGWVSLLHGDFFLEQRDLRSNQMERLVNHIRDIYLPRKRKWIVLFPEGGFLRKRRQKGQEYARKNGYPVLSLVTLPRLGALQTILSSISPRYEHQNGVNHQTDAITKKVENARPLKWLVDITVGYQDNKALNFQTIVAGTRNPFQVVLHYRKFPITDLPLETEDLTKWINDRFVEKEKMLEIFYRTGKFPLWDAAQEKIEENVLTNTVSVPLSLKKIMLSNLFYLVVLCATLKCVVFPVFAMIF